MPCHKQWASLSLCLNMAYWFAVLLCVIGRKEVLLYRAKRSVFLADPVSESGCVLEVAHAQWRIVPYWNEAVIGEASGDTASEIYLEKLRAGQTRVGDIIISLDYNTC